MQETSKQMVNHIRIMIEQQMEAGSRFRNANVSNMTVVSHYCCL